MVFQKRERAYRGKGSLQALGAAALAGALLLALSGCGKSQEEAAKQDAQGKQTNEQAMNRMIQEQNRNPSQAGGGK